MATLVSVSQFASTCMSGILSREPSILILYSINGVILAVGYYFWDVVYSVYKDMENKTENTSNQPIYVIMEVYHLEAKGRQGTQWSMPVGLKIGLSTKKSRSNSIA